MVKLNTGMLMNQGRKQRSLVLTMMQMSSGDRIFRSGQDSAGLSISARMRSQIRGDSVAVRNMADSQNLTRVAEGVSLADLDLQTNPSQALSVIDDAIGQISSQQGAMGTLDSPTAKAVDFLRLVSVKQSGDHSVLGTRFLPSRKMPYAIKAKDMQSILIG